jgi:hypothetical protein
MAAAALLDPASGTAVYVRPSLSFMKGCQILIGILVVVQAISLNVLHLSKNQDGVGISASAMIADTLNNFIASAPNSSSVASTEDQVTWRLNGTTAPSNHIQVPRSHTDAPAHLAANSTKIPTARFAHLYNDTAPSLCNLHNCPIWREPNSVVADWMKTYFDWHSKTRPLVSHQNWRSHRYIIMKCSARDRCGGTSDRIKPFPLMLWFAYMHKRILLIHWERPCKLEEFLVPPKGGLDWRMPQTMKNHMAGPSEHNVENIVKACQKTDNVIIRIKYQSYHGGRLTYDEEVEGPTFSQIYHDVWQIMFTPSRQLAVIIQNKLKEHNLIPGNYAAIHLRALYAVDERPLAKIETMALNALACATHLRPGGPFYFASDSAYAAAFITKWAKNNTHGRVEAVLRDYEPLHLEMAENWTIRPVSDFYDTFTDLYLMGLSRCVAYGVGGYGQWGLMMGYNSSCYKVHSLKKKSEPCNWFNGTIPEHEHVEISGPIWRNPIEIG